MEAQLKAQGSSYQKHHAELKWDYGQIESLIFHVMDAATYPLFPELPGTDPVALTKKLYARHEALRAKAGARSPNEEVEYRAVRLKIRDGWAHHLSYLYFDEYDDDGKKPVIEVSLNDGTKLTYRPEDEDGLVTYITKRLHAGPVVSDENPLHGFNFKP